ncbi:MAG: hypothetical protein KDB80_14275 [Planctomycetes bacterium]|nr:hypothetical protein [Planctomycetota bacterium]
MSACRPVVVGRLFVGALVCVPAMAQVDASLKPVLSRDHASRMLAALDHAVDADDYASLFDPLYPDLHRLRTEWVRNALAAAGSARSELRDFATLGDRGVMLVHTTFGADATRLEVDRYVAFRADGRGLRATFDVEVNPKALPEAPLSRGDYSKFGCPACNYVMQPDDDWLVVPHVSERVGCLEAFSFYSLHSPTSVDVSVHLMTEQTPRALLEGLVREETTSRDVVGEVEPWQPTRYRSSTAPKGLEGARVEIASARSETTILHALRFGPVMYLFAAAGPGAHLDGERGRVDALLDSFMLRETDLGRVQATVRPVMMHTGGELDGAVYHNERLGLDLRGPDGWSSTLHCGGHLAHVSWSCPEHRGRMTLRVLAPPPGRMAWTELAADSSIDCCLESNPLTVEKDSGWHRAGAAGSARDIRFARDADGAVRQLRVVRPEDGGVLIVIDAQAPADELAAVVRCFDSLERR